MDPLKAYAGNNLMNMVAVQAHTRFRNRFKGAGNEQGFSYSFDVQQAPLVSLVHNNSAHNLLMDLKRVTIKASGNGLNVVKDLRIQATAKLAMRNGIVSLTGLKVLTPSSQGLDRLIVNLINTQVLPKIAEALQAIEVPQLSNVFGTGLSAALRTASVLTGPALEVGARIAGKTGLSEADTPSATEKAQLNNGSASDARMIAVVSHSALNVLLKATVGPLSHTFNESGSKGPFGAGIKGTIKASTPVLEIKNGRATASTTITFSSLKAGIKIPIKGWTWVNLPKPTVKLVVTHKLTSVQNKGVVELTGVDKLTVSFNWPTVLKPVGSVLQALLNGVLTLFKGLISQAVRGQKLQVFELPSKIPGTSIGATLSLVAGGFGYVKSSLRAIIRVKT